MRTRREVLKAAALTGLASACGQPRLEGRPGTVDAPAVATATEPAWQRRVARDEPRQVSTDFPLGVSSGDLMPGSAIVQARYTGAAPLSVRVWSESRELVLPVTPGDGGFSHVEVPGLEDDTLYSYAFLEGGRYSPIGRFRSAPAETSQRVIRLGAVSCTDIPNDLSALRHASERTDLDAFMLLGDTTYADGSTTLAEYREKWAQSLSRPLYVALRAQVPLLATWDDHEVDNDWDPERMPASKLAAARASFFEHLPLRRDSFEPDRVWRSFRFGQSVEVFVLDSRSERKPSTLLSGGTTYVSDRQLAWLKSSLAASPCTFKVLMNSVPITHFPFSDFYWDSWNAYRAQREDLLSFIDANVRGVLWVSGDHHFASAGRVSASGPGAAQLEVLAGPGAQDSAPLWRACAAPQFDWASGENNYLALELDPASHQVVLTFWGKSGQVLKELRYTL